MSNGTGEIGYLKKTIKQIVETNVTTVQEVAGYEKSGFNGFPAVTIVCSGNENSFYSSVENERIFHFTMKIFYPFENLPAGEPLANAQDSAKETAENIMEQVIDQIINVFDTTANFTMGEVADNGIEATPSTWGYALLQVGWCRVATVELKVRRTLLVN